MKHLSIWLVLLAFFNGIAVLAADVPSDCVQDGVRIPYQGTARFFSDTAPPAGRTCSMISAFRTCTAQGLSDPSEFTKATCANPDMAPVPAASLATGAYASPVTVSLFSPGATVIRYTTDNTIPTCRGGTVYSEPFILFASTTVNAVACNSSFQPSDVSTTTYTMNTKDAPLCSYQQWLNDFEVTRQAGTASVAPQKRCWNADAFWANSQNGTRENPAFEIISLAPLPKSEHDEKYAYYPMNIVYAMGTTSMLAQPAAEMGGVKQYLLPWSNRCQWNTQERDGCACKKKVADPVSDATCGGYAGKGNSLSYVFGQDPITGKRTQASYVFFYTSVEKADACTTAQTLAFLGASAADVRAEIARAPGLALVTTKEQVDKHVGHLDTYAKRVAMFGKTWVDKYQNGVENRRGPWVSNVCYTPALKGGALDGIDQKFVGITLDYEVGDGRSPAQAASFIQHYTSMARKQRPGMKIFLLSDPILGAGKNAGLSAESGPDILKAVDGVPVALNPGKNCLKRNAGYIANIEQEMKIWNGGVSVPQDKSKFIVQYLDNNDENIAPMIRQYVLDNKIKYIDFSQNYVRQSACDVSDAASTPWTQPARHAKDLYGLSDPTF